MITSRGLRLGTRYVLTERLAVGGMGEVWSAVDEVLDRPVAVKVLRTDLATDTTFQARFRAEARTAAALSHGGIASVYDYGESDDAAYLVMELVPGEPLSTMIADQGALGSDRTLQIVSQAARALHAAHRHGVVHRDIKPANLMITPELRVKVTDFGIARPRDHEPLTATGQVMGTAHYLAPELARGEIASPLSDVYALGVVAYECLAGWRPFDGDNQVEVATAHLQDEPPPLPETIPAPVRAIVVAAMSKDPAGRPQGAHALAGVMEDVRLHGLAGGHAASTAARRGSVDAAGGPPARRDDAVTSSARTTSVPATFLPATSLPATSGPATAGPATSRPPTPGPVMSGPATSVRGSSGGTDRSAPAGGHRHRHPAGAPARSRRLVPETSVLPAERSARRRPRRRRPSTPLLALLALILVVLLGSLWAHYRNGLPDTGLRVGIGSALHTSAQEAAGASVAVTAPDGG